MFFFFPSRIILSINDNWRRAPRDEPCHVYLLIISFRSRRCIIMKIFIFSFFHFSIRIEVKKRRTQMEKKVQKKKSYFIWVDIRPNLSLFSSRWLTRIRLLLRISTSSTNLCGLLLSFVSSIYFFFCISLFRLLYIQSQTCIEVKIHFFSIILSIFRI